MAIVVDNNFSNDSYSIRGERLNAIQGNSTSFQLELYVPAPISTWADKTTQNYSTHGLSRGLVDCKKMKNLSQNIWEFKR